MKPKDYCYNNGNTCTHYNDGHCMNYSPPLLVYGFAVCPFGMGNFPKLETYCELRGVAPFDITDSGFYVNKHLSRILKIQSENDPESYLLQFSDGSMIRLGTSEWVGESEWVTMEKNDG